MSLIDVCRKITQDEKLCLAENHPMGTRLVCPEYSKSVKEVKTFPLVEQQSVFALCWNTDRRQVHSTMVPAPHRFCCSYSFGEGEKTQLHTHDYLELGYVVKGEFRQKISGKDIVFRKGELCLIDKNCVHQDYLQNKESVILFLGLSNNMFTEVMNENVSTEKVISFLQSALLKQKNLQQYIRFKPSPETEAALEKAFEQLVEELLVNDTGSTFICKGLMVRIFGLLSTGCEFSLSRELRQEMSWIVYEEITEYIAHHYATVTIRELVENFHFQEDYFNRLIRSKAGISYSEYVQRIRLEKAEALLRTSSMTVDEVAEAVGYQNKGYFYKIFKKEFGMTPRQMRVNGL